MLPKMCPFCGSPVFLQENLNANTDLFVASDYGGHTEYYDGPCKSYSCGEESHRFYITVEDKHDSLPSDLAE